MRAARLSAELGQLLLVGFEGTGLAEAPDLDRLLCAERVGGLLIFARNVRHPDQLARLTAGIRARARACSGSPPLIAIDAEGGRVMRLGEPAGWAPTLSAGELGATNDLALTELEALRIGRRLAGAGLDWNLAPVVDVGYNPANPVVVGAERSYSANPALVTAHARAFIRGMRRAGILTALKHFPGHGSSFADPHHGFVDVTDTADSEVELYPYRVLIAEGLADAIMTAHVLNRRLDPEYPATLSRRTIGGLLRAELRFDGLVVTDDLRMAAIEGRWGLAEAARLALDAGADMLLITDDRLPGGRSATAGVLEALGEALAWGGLDPDRVASALARVRALKTRLLIGRGLEPSPDRPAR